jgi:hypothetical protein
LRLFGYAILDNHVHIALEVPPGVDEVLAEDEYLARLWVLYRGNTTHPSYLKAAAQVETHVAAGVQPPFAHRMGCLSECTKTVAQQFAQDHLDEILGPRRAPAALWRVHHTSSDIHGPTALRTVLIYIALNRCAAGIDAFPGATEFDAYGRALRGCPRTRQAFIDALGAPDWPRAKRQFDRLLAEHGSIPRADKKPLRPEVVARLLDGTNRLDIAATSKPQPTDYEGCPVLSYISRLGDFHAIVDEAALRFTDPAYKPAKLRTPKKFTDLGLRSTKLPRKLRSERAPSDDTPPPNPGRIRNFPAHIPFPTHPAAPASTPSNSSTKFRPSPTSPTTKLTRLRHTQHRPRRRPNFHTIIPAKPQHTPSQTPLVPPHKPRHARTLKPTAVAPKSIPKQHRPRNPRPIRPPQHTPASRRPSPRRKPTTTPTRSAIFHLPTTPAARDTWKHLSHHLRSTAPTQPPLRHGPDKDPDRTTHVQYHWIAAAPATFLHKPRTTAPPATAPPRAAA